METRNIDHDNDSAHALAVYTAENMSSEDLIQWAIDDLYSTFQDRDAFYAQFDVLNESEYNEFIGTYARLTE